MNRIGSLVIFAAFIVTISGGAVGAELSPEDLYNQANEQFWDGEYRRAETTFRTLADNFPNHDLYWDARYGMGRALYKQGKMEESVSNFEAVRRNHPESSVRGDALYSLAEVAILRNRTIRAREFLRIFLDLFPDHVLKPTAREQIKLLGDPSDSPRTTSRDPRTTEAGPHTEQTQSSRPRLKSDSVGETKARNVLDSLKQKNISADSSTLERSGLESRGDSSPETVKKTSTRKQTLPVHTILSDTDPINESTSGTSSVSYKKQTDSSETVASRMDSPDKEDENDNPDMDTATVNQFDPDTAPGQEADTFTRKQFGENNESGADPDDENQPSKPLEYRAMERIRKNFQEGQVTQAREQFDPDYLNDQSSPEDYYLAARLVNRGGDQDRSLEYINQAITNHDNPPPEYHLLQTELQVSKNQIERAKKALASVDPDQFGDDRTKEKARYFYLRGKIALELGNDDEAFFHLMDSVRSAPSSKWSQQARETIEERL